MTKRRRLMMMTAGSLSERLAGPEIRTLEFAKALSADFEVTLVANRPDSTTRDGMRVIPPRRRVILSELMRTDVVISPSLPPYLLALKPLLGFDAISDQYDPYELELASLGDDRHNRELQTRMAFRSLQLRQADLVLCAGERQREALIAAASTEIVQGNPLAVDPVVVPFGIRPAPPASGRTPLRERFPQIGHGDKLVIWWGSVWHWLDAETPIRAFAQIARTRSDVKFVITAGAAPASNSSRFEATASAVALAQELGVAGTTVFFVDEWIPYEERYDYLGEALLGLTLHRDSQEAELAARARYMDYLSAGLPCVLGRGDEIAEEFERAGYATLVDRPDPDLLASTLLALLDDSVALERRRSAGIRLAEQRQWSAIGEQLRSAVASIPRHKQRDLGRAAGDLAGDLAYYCRRLADEFVGAFG